MEEECFGNNKYNKLDLESMLKDEIYKFLVVEEEKNYLGYVILLDNGFELEIMKIGTLQKFRNLGIGTKIVEELETYKKDIFLEVRENNEIAIKFYHKNGFYTVGRRKNYYTDTKEDAILMKKDYK